MIDRINMTHKRLHNKLQLYVIFLRAQDIVMIVLMLYAFRKLQNYSFPAQEKTLYGENKKT